MENTEATQLAPKPATVLVACSDTIFGRGNQLKDPVLLNQLEILEPLPPVQAANLALFLVSFYGNRPLAFHVAELTLLSIATHPKVQPATQGASSFDLADWWEDLCDGGDEPSDAMTPQLRAQSLKQAADDQSVLPQLFAIPLLAGLALLVESQTKGEKTSYFVIGVSPDPATIPSLLQLPARM